MSTTPGPQLGYHHAGSALARRTCPQGLQDHAAESNSCLFSSRFCPVPVPDTGAPGRHLGCCTATRSQRPAPSPHSPLTPGPQALTGVNQPTESPRRCAATSRAGGPALGRASTMPGSWCPGAPAVSSAIHFHHRFLLSENPFLSSMC